MGLPRSYHSKLIKWGGLKFTLLKTGWRGKRLLTMHPSIAPAHRPRTALIAVSCLPRPVLPRSSHSPLQPSPQPFCQPCALIYSVNCSFIHFAPGLEGRFLMGVSFRHGRGMEMEGECTPSSTSRRIHSNTVCIWISLIAHSGILWPSPPTSSHRPTFNQSQGNPISVFNSSRTKSITFLRKWIISS